MGNLVSMKLAYPDIQLHTRILCHIPNNVASLNCWVTVCNEALIRELLFWKDIPRLRFESDIWPSKSGLSMQVAMDACVFG